VTVIVKWNVVAVVPLVGDTEPVYTVVPQDDAATLPGATNSPNSRRLIASATTPGSRDG
jgi:hypothetical protein